MFPTEAVPVALLKWAFAQVEIKSWHSGPEKCKLQVKNGCLEAKEWQNLQAFHFLQMS